MTPAQLKENIRKLLVALKKEITDDCRATDDSDDNIPGMQVTIATDDNLSQWAYQTGDNSYTGSCYSLRHWAVIYLHRRSNSRELAKEAMEELLEAVHSATGKDLA